MAKLYETKAPSNHIEVEAFLSAAEKGDAVKIGSLTGLADYNTAVGEAGSVNIGRPASVFQGAIADLDGTAEVGADIYLTPEGAFSTTATDNTLIGTVVAVTAETFEFAKL